MNEILQISHRTRKKISKKYFSELVVICCSGIPGLIVEEIILFSLTPKIDHLIVRITMEKKEERLY